MFTERRTLQFCPLESDAFARARRTAHFATLDAVREWQIAGGTRQFVTASTDGGAALKRTQACIACSTGSLSGTASWWTPRLGLCQRPLTVLKDR